MRQFIYWFSVVTMTITMVPSTSYAGGSDPRPSAPYPPSVVQVPQTLSVEVTATLPGSATGSQMVRFFRDDVLMGEVAADASRQATLTDAYNLQGGVTYAYRVTYYETPDGFESYSSPSATITIDGSTLLPPPPAHGGFAPPPLPVRDCGHQGDFYEPGTFTVVNVPLGAQVNLYRDDTLVAQGTSVPNGWFPPPGFEGKLSLETDIHWRHQYPGDTYDYRFTYIDENGIESQRSSARTVTIPQCAITDFPTLEDGEFNVGIYLVRFQDTPDLPWSVADMNRYFFCSDSDPGNPCPPDDGGYPQHLNSIPVQLDYETRGQLAVNGEAYGAAGGTGLLTWPVDAAIRCPSASECGPADVLATEIFSFIQSQAHIPTENYDAHMILMYGWDGSLHPGYNFAANEEVGNLSMLGPVPQIPTASETGTMATIHEALVHGIFGYGHGGNWDCAAIPDSDVGPSLEDMLAGGCTIDLGNQWYGGTLREKIGVYQPGEILEVTASGEYEVGHWGSSYPVKRLDISLSNHATYTFEYRVLPREYYDVCWQYPGNYGVLYAHVRLDAVPAGTFANQESFRIKLAGGFSNGMDLCPTWGDATFDDPYRGIHVELLQETSETALVRIDFD